MPASCDLPLPCSIFKMWTRAKTKSFNTNSRSSSAGSSGFIRPALIIPADQDIAPSSPLFATSPLRFPSTDSLSSEDFWAPGEAQYVSSEEEYWEKAQVKLESRSSPASISPLPDFGLPSPPFPLGSPLQLSPGNIAPTLDETNPRAERKV